MKEIIMMIHGMWGNDGVWVRFKQYFEAAGYSCITPVLRFHSMKTDSPPSAALGRTSLLDYAQDLENEISVMPIFDTLSVFRNLYPSNLRGI